MDLLIAAASATFDGTPQPLTTGLSLMARYSQGSFAKSKPSQEEPTDQTTLPPQEEAQEPESEAVAPTGAADTTVSTAVQEEPRAEEDAEQLPAQVVSVVHETVSTAEVPTLQASITADAVIGIRHPRNDQRRVLPDPANPTNVNAARGRCSDVYRQLCDVYDVHTNSRVMKILKQHEDNTQIPQNPFEDLISLDLSLCMLRDKGMLPVVEMLRLCVNLKYLGLASNDISNSGIEYLAHAVVEGTVGSSFEVMESNDVDGNGNNGGGASTSYSAVENRIEKAGTTMMSTTNRFGVNIATLDVSDNMISLGGMRLIQLIAEKLPSLVDVRVEGARVDACEFSELEGILEENRLYCG
jgi:hypothetical protein